METFILKNKKLHMIGNAHLDPVWLWRWQEGFQEVKATFRSALDRMTEYEDFIFTSSTAAIYEWIENNEPRMFQEIRRRVAEGRWVLCGGWWVQSDCNLPSGESFVRQGLYGQRYFQEKFGVMSTVGYNVDSFGHHAMLPQLLRKSGMDRYVFMRPGEHEKHLDTDLFWWESDDGSRVLAYRIPFYTHLSMGEIPGAFEAAVAYYVKHKLEPSSPHDQLLFFGVGNHGGGPTKQNIEAIVKMNEDPQYPELVFSSPDRYFDQASTEGIPVLRDELQMHAKGCYSVQSDVKRWNRKAEQLLVTAEKYAIVADRVAGQPYPDRMGQAWKNVLFNQFHDILPGSSIEAVYEQDARDSYGEANAIAGRALNDALQSISWRIRIDPDDRMKPIVVFNPHSWPTKGNVELEFGHFGYSREYHSFVDTDILLDEEGKQIPIQRVKSSSSTIWRQRLSFIAELPPLGYRTYRVVSGDNAGALVAFTPVDASDHRMENDGLRLELDPRTGWIASLFDKRNRVELFRGPAAQPVVIEDTSDTWSHGVERFDKEIGAFVATRLRRIEHGPVKSVIRVESEYGQSRVIQHFTLYKDLHHVEVNVTVDWREQWKMLKLRFPVNVDTDKTTYEIPYGTIERTNNGDEVPGLSWFDQSGTANGGDFLYGLSILNDGKYSFDAQGHCMNMTILRSPIYAHDAGEAPDPDGWYTFMDQGIQHFTYVLLPHEGDWKQAGTVKRAAELNQPPMTVIETYHQGDLPQTDRYIEIDEDNIIVSAMKKAEDNGDLIVRCYETNHTATRAKVTLPKWNRVIEAEFGPCEIKTFRIPQDASLPVVETDFLERPC